LYLFELIDPLIIYHMDSIPIAIPQEIHILLFVVKKDTMKNMENNNCPKQMQYLTVILLLFNIVSSYFVL